MDTARILRVLVVESDVLRRNVLQEILHGIEVDCAVVETATEGLWKLCAGHYGVVVLAEHLPDMTGAMAARVIQDGGGGQPVVVGLADDEVGIQAFVAAGADYVLPGVPDLDLWADCMRRFESPVVGLHGFDMASLEAWRDFQGPEIYDVVVRDFVDAGAAAMVRLRQQIARADVPGAAQTSRIFGSHSRIVGAHALARACEDLELAFMTRDLKAASGHLFRVQDDWLRIRGALEPQHLRLAE